VTGVRKPSAAAKGRFALLEHRILSDLKKQGMLRPGDRVGVAVSGGADSVALLRLLLELRGKLGIVLSLVHFNHKLRGKASDTDEKFVAQLAARHGLELHSASVEVAKKAKKERANIEDAARRARYDYFRALTESGVCKRIAVAHTADDQAETVLAHLLRGTGLAGLGGIHPVALDAASYGIFCARGNKPGVRMPPIETPRRCARESGKNFCPYLKNNFSQQSLSTLRRSRTLHERMRHF